MVESVAECERVSRVRAGSRRGEVERAIIFSAMGDRPSFITRENGRLLVRFGFFLGFVLGHEFPRYLSEL